ncbi:hypothetical protein BU23DRAFT_187497 [Bimuria novae-zelandiae CBS 107.79]|uniref:Uncharacterized protein n=1 Tax=Bimuria novae-zelandiae CBS 107.79 TaxID=1447943 RepID=A0A6A5VSS2_9PLEO|nr:hypothetical protein BU23DRAFT_187497 [Bimuria novae-zelandiae CBS 107.79]
MSHDLFRSLKTIKEKPVRTSSWTQSIFPAVSAFAEILCHFANIVSIFYALYLSVVGWEWQGRVERKEWAIHIR